MYSKAIPILSSKPQFIDWSLEMQLCLAILTVYVTIPRCTATRAHYITRTYRKSITARAKKRAATKNGRPAHTSPELAPLIKQTCINGLLTIIPRLSIRAAEANSRPWCCSSTNSESRPRSIRPNGNPKLKIARPSNSILVSR